MSEPPASPGPSTSKDDEESVTTQALKTIWAARVATDWNDDLSSTFFHNYQTLKRLSELLPELEQVYQQSQATHAPHVRKAVERNFDEARRKYDYATTILPIIGDIASAFATDRAAFHSFMNSRGSQRAYADLLEQQLAANRCLYENKILLQADLSGAIDAEDIPAVAHYMANCETYFDREFRRFGRRLFTPEPRDEDIATLRGLVSAMSFHSVRSLGRLFAQGQYIRCKLEACGEVFLDVWADLSVEEEKSVSQHLAAARALTYVSRHGAMIVAANALQFVHDEENDRFFQFCRKHEDSIRSSADLLYEAQDRLQRFKDMTEHLLPDRILETNPSSYAVDPVEMRIKEVHPKLIPGGYNVFLAHDSKEGLPLANYLQTKIQLRGFSCYMESVPIPSNLLFMQDETERALDDACIGVFLLTPEFAKEKWKGVQLRHMLRRVREARVGWPGPILIPVFYKVSVRGCRDGDIFGESKEDADFDDLDKDDVERAFDEITRYTGIENLEGVIDEDSKEMAERRQGMMERTADAVAEACVTIMKEGAEELRVMRNEDVNDEGKEGIEKLREMITDFRRSQRDARKRASYFAREVHMS